MTPNRDIFEMFMELSSHLHQAHARIDTLNVEEQNWKGSDKITLALAHLKAADELVRLGVNVFRERYYKEQE